MFLRNYYNLAAAAFIGCTNVATSAQTGKTPSSENLLIHAIDNKYYYAGYKNVGPFSTVDVTTALLNTSYSSSSSHGVKFGSGTTPPTVDDYKLESKITSGLTVNASKFTPPTYDSGNNKHIRQQSYTIINSGSSSVTISEIGIEAAVLAGSTSSSSSSKQTLIYRSVFDTPIVIPAGDAATITITLEYAMPI